MNVDKWQVLICIEKTKFRQEAQLSLGQQTAGLRLKPGVRIPVTKRKFIRGETVQWLLC